jgi:hypothetical protein
VKADALEGRAVTPEPPPEYVPEEPVFDLTAELEAPPLPLVEVEAEEPPALSVQELLPQVDAEPAPAVELASQAVSEFMPGLLTTEPAEAPPAHEEFQGPSADLDLDALSGTRIAEAETAAVAPFLDRLEVPLTSAVPLSAAPPTEAPAVAAAVESELTVMRQAVTERVAHELARDLSAKLIDRIERVVWEVVPELAEILITKEIERIRAQGEGQQTS